MVAEVAPSELAQLLDAAERPRSENWSLRAALTRYAQPQPQRASAVIELVRRIEAALHSSAKRLEREGPAIWELVRAESDPGEDDVVLVGVLRALLELDTLADDLAEWAVARATERPDVRVDVVVADVTERLELLGVEREERRPAGRPSGTGLTMARLMTMAMMSIDGYIEDRAGDFGWAEPDEEVHRFANDLLRPIGTHLYGRRLYETMSVWETDASLAEESEILRDFAEVWQRGDKVVYSTTLEQPVTARTRIERVFDPAVVRAAVSSAASDYSIGGASLAGQALQAGIVDEVHVLLAPVVVGGGKPAFPVDGLVGFELLDERRFSASGVVYLRYQTESGLT